KFGSSVALSGDGNRLAVGAVGDLSKAKGINGDGADYEIVTTSVATYELSSRYAYGAAYLFSHAGAGWQQDAYIKAPNADMYDEFGHAVALSADGLTLAVSTINEASAAKGINGNADDNSADGVGAVYVYSVDAAGLQYRSYVKPANTRGG